MWLNRFIRGRKDPRFNPDILSERGRLTGAVEADTAESAVKGAKNLINVATVLSRADAHAARAIVTQWDEQVITGTVFSSGITGVGVVLSDVVLGYFAQGTDNVTLEHDSFRIRTEFIPASCVYDLTIAVHFRDGEIIHLTHPAARTAGNARMHSAFGGMWIDRADWEDTLAIKQASNLLSPHVAELIRQFVRDGYIVLPKAVNDLTIARLNEEIDAAWHGRYPGMQMEVYSIPGRPHAVIGIDPRYRDETHKLLDTYVYIDAAREAAAAPAAAEFMAAVFDDQPKAFQQLTFGWGSQQAIHKDTAYVKIDGNPMSMLATWVALEDITEGTGELEYYVGSHTAPDYVFGGISKWLEASPSQFDDFLAALHRDAQTYRQKKSRFIARAGDVLIWHADLAHGGSPITKPGVTRKSIVTHYTAARNDPYYRRWSNFQSLDQGGVRFISSHGPINA